MNNECGDIIMTDNNNYLSEGSSQARGAISNIAPIDWLALLAPFAHQYR